MHRNQPSQKRIEVLSNVEEAAGNNLLPLFVEIDFSRGDRSFWRRQLLRKGYNIGTATEFGRTGIWFYIRGPKDPKRHRYAVKK